MINPLNTKTVNLKLLYMHSKSLSLIFIYLLAINIPVFSQSISKDFTQTIAQIRKGKYFDGTTPFKKYMNSSSGQLIKESERYLSDSLVPIRNFAYELINASGKRNADISIRQKVVLDLLRGSNDNFPGIVDVTSKYLKQYQQKDFNAAAIDSIKSIIHRGNKYIEHIILVAGYINIPDLKADLKTIIANPHQKDKTKWAAHLALSRMGEESETSYCIQLMQSRNLDNAIVYNMTPGLIYTHQKMAYDYLITLLNSNEKNCISPNPDNGVKILCAYRIMEFLAPVIIDFPLKTDRDVNQIKTDNYDTALETARAWFKIHMSDYMIKKDSL